MTETWREVPGFEGRYEVSDLGNVRSVDVRVRCPNGSRVKRGKPVAKNRINSGYDIVHFHVDRIRSALLVHRAVVSAFIGPISEGMTVNHKNGVKTDNRLENLEVVTYSENHVHAVYIGLNTSAVRVRAVCVKTGATREFPSFAEAAFQLSGSRKNESVVRRVARGGYGRKSAYGYRLQVLP